jgi:spectinomycin phosphotransferase
VKTLPDDFDESELTTSLAEGWGFHAELAEYEPVGFGSYHWVVADAEGRRGFVTVDDLDQKPWLGDTRAARLDGLRCAFDTAAALRDVGLGFVVGPVRGRSGETVRPIGSKHTIALFPFVEGRAGRFGRYETAEERAAVAAMLAELHRATPVVRGLARRGSLAVPGRPELEAGLRDLNQPWEGGPLSEPARRAFASHADDIGAVLAAFDRLAREVATRPTEWVVTHGEPHAANVVRADEGLFLVDWDTVAVAPPERDLWMLETPTGDEIGSYAYATGHRVDHDAIELFRLAWDLADLAAYVATFRSAHRETPDTFDAYDNLVGCARVRDRWASMLGDPGSPTMRRKA